MRVYRTPRLRLFSATKAAWVWSSGEPRETIGLPRGTSCSQLWIPFSLPCAAMPELGRIGERFKKKKLKIRLPSYRVPTLEEITRNRVAHYDFVISTCQKKKSSAPDLGTTAFFPFFFSCTRAAAVPVAESVSE